MSAERKKIIDQVIGLPRQFGNYVAREIKNYQDEKEYFRFGYLRDPPKDGKTEKLRTISDGPFELREQFQWNQEASLWQVTSREWIQTTPDPVVENKPGFIAGIKTRCRQNEIKNLRLGLAQRQAFFAPPQGKESTSKSECYSEDNEVFYRYLWNPERNIWDEVGKYIVIRERGQMH
jgi:hypothetical protein